MKRRVLRTHVNKKNLRTLQTAHRIKEPYNVICDETFLRSVCGAADKHTSLTAVVSEAMGSCKLFVLPETLVALERHKQACALSFASTECALWPDAVGPSQPRNELKAIAAAVKESKLFVFVATQSHDLRAMLPNQTGVLRASFGPLAVWVESNDHSSTGNDTQKATQTLPVADVAYLKSLGLSIPGEATVKVQSASPRPARFAPKGAKAPNPLSVKKKSVRETVCVDDEPLKQKKRPS